MLSDLCVSFFRRIYIPPEHPGPPGNRAVASQHRDGAAALSPRDLGLTDRQVDVLALMMQGKSNKRFAELSIWPSRR